MSLVLVEYSVLWEYKKVKMCSVGTRLFYKESLRYTLTRQDLLCMIVMACRAEWNLSFSGHSTFSNIHRHTYGLR